MGHRQRERLYEAILDELLEPGYEHLDLDRVLARAGVSHRAFDAEFGDEDSCLFAAYDELTESLVREATAGCAGEGEWPQRVGRALEAILDELAARPRMARVLCRSFPAIRPLAHLRYVEFLESFAPFLREGRELGDLGDDLPGEIEMLAIGAAEALVLDEIDAGRTAGLPARAPSILFSLLVPFVGAERARAVTAAGRQQM